MKKILLLSTLCLTATFVACNKNDDSDYQSSERYILAPTDLETYGLLGKVKSYTYTSWDYGIWENNAVVVTGYPEEKDEFEFNMAGYITSLKAYHYDREKNKFMAHLLFKLTYDALDRPISLEEYGIENGVLIPYSKSVIVYDDVNKNATQRAYNYQNGNWVETSEYRVSQLNKYGRIDENNYEILYAETRTQKKVTKYDTHGNPTESYYLWDEQVANYRTYEYEYYK